MNRDKDKPDIELIQGLLKSQSGQGLRKNRTQPGLSGHQQLAAFSGRSACICQAFD